MIGQIRRLLTETTGEFDPVRMLKAAMEAMGKLRTQRVNHFARAGKASKVKRILPLAAMAPKASLSARFA